MVMMMMMKEKKAGEKEEEEEEEGAIRPRSFTVLCCPTPLRFNRPIVLVVQYL